MEYRNANYHISLCQHLGITRAQWKKQWPNFWKSLYQTTNCKLMLYSGCYSNTRG